MTNNKKAKKQTTKQKKFKFIDLFAGVGGIRIPFEELGGKCVFTSEWDKFSQITYEANFGEKPHGDITQIDLPKNIESGLGHSIRVLKDVEGIGFTVFSSRDVVRHPLVRKIVDAYDQFDQKKN